MDDVQLADRLVGILSELIAIPSHYPPSDTRAICAYAADFLRKAGYEPEVCARKPDVDNVVARIGSAHPIVAFNAHVDTVGVGEMGTWRTDPFAAQVANGQVIGLGAGNCKGSMAVQLWLAEEVKRRGGPARGEAVFTFVGDEENLGPDGMAFLRESGRVRPDVLVLGAQTENQLIVAERGVMWARITTTGVAAHAGTPERGDNAVMRMVRIVNALDHALAPRLAARHDGAMRSTFNVGMFHGGHNANVVPSLCTVDIDRRLLPGETVTQAFAELVELVDKAGEPAGSYRVELLTGTNGFRGPENGAALAAFRSAIERISGHPARLLNAVGVSDGRYYADDGIEIINFGPGSGAQGHAANESVPIADMVSAARIQIAVVERLLGLKR